MGFKFAEKQRKKRETNIYTTAPMVLRRRIIEGGQTSVSMKKKMDKV